ncbi:MAG TPA: OsmC family protein [Longimicrobium sp.]
MSEESVSVDLSLRGGYAFEADFHLPGVPALLLDEPAPLGEGAGPSASRLLAAAVGNCLSASLLFCMRKAHVEVEGMETHVDATIVRNERGRMRIGGIRVRLEPALADEDAARIARCAGLFEDFCIVGQSVLQGIDVQVEVNATTPAAA